MDQHYKLMGNPWVIRGRPVDQYCYCEIMGAHGLPTMWALWGAFHGYFIGAPSAAYGTPTGCPWQTHPRPMVDPCASRKKSGVTHGPALLDRVIITGYPWEGHGRPMGRPWARAMNTWKADGRRMENKSNLRATHG